MQSELATCLRVNESFAADDYVFVQPDGDCRMRVVEESGDEIVVYFPLNIRLDGP